MNYLLIDIRKSDEVYSKHLLPGHNYKHYNIPMNMIQFNVDNIKNHLKYIDEIYIICHSGKRASFIKNKYFKDNDKIKVDYNLQFKNFNKGINNIKLRTVHEQLNINKIHRLNIKTHYIDTDSNKD